MKWNTIYASVVTTAFMIRTLTAELSKVMFCGFISANAINAPSRSFNGKAESNSAHSPLILLLFSYKRCKDVAVADSISSA